MAAISTSAMEFENDCTNIAVNAMCGQFFHCRHCIAFIYTLVWLNGLLPVQLHFVVPQPGAISVFLLNVQHMPALSLWRRDFDRGRRGGRESSAERRARIASWNAERETGPAAPNGAGLPGPPPGAYNGGGPYGGPGGGYPSAPPQRY